MLRIVSSLELFTFSLRLDHSLLASATLPKRAAVRRTPVMESEYKWRDMVLCLGMIVYSLYIYCLPVADLCVDSLEGGGVKGFSSLLMLQRLMDKIAEIEKQTSLPKGINIDAGDWEPHYSSFDPISEDFDPKLLQMSHETATSPYRTTRDSLREEMTKRRGKYLPCHYFDYIGGTSTGGSVLKSRTLP